MKTLALLSALLLAGCGPSKVEEPKPVSNLRRVVNCGDLYVYVTTIDDTEYVIAMTSAGVSIIPKSKP